MEGRPPVTEVSVLPKVPLSLVRRGERKGRTDPVEGPGDCQSGGCVRSVSLLGRVWGRRSSDWTAEGHWTLMLKDLFPPLPTNGRFRTFHENRIAQLNWSYVLTSSSAGPHVGPVLSLRVPERFPPSEHTWGLPED